MAFAGPPLPVTQINTYTTGEQTNAAVTGLAGGGYVVFWTSAGQDGSAAGIYSQMFDADGVAVGGETPVNTTTAGEQDFADAAALDAGGYVAVWTSYGQDGDSDGLYMQRYDASGVAVGGETLVNTTTAGSQSDATVIGLSTGGFAVAWSEYNGASTIRLQIFDAAGAAVGGEVTVAAPSGGLSAIWPRLTEMDSGRIAVTWNMTELTSANDDPYVQLVRANGTLFGGPVQMNTTPGTHATQTQIVALPGGGFMAIWSESIGATGAVGVGDARIVGRVYDNAGVALTGEFTVSDGVTDLRYDPAVTLGGDGNVYVGWLEQTGNGEVYVMRGIDPTGALVGDQFYIGDLVPVTTINRFLDLTTLANGDIIASWQSWFGTSDIVTRRIFMADGDPRVSDADDVVVLAAGGDLMDSGGGADDITGGTGDDIVFGNDGADTLFGSSGQDFLSGGNAGDTVDGGTEDDIVQGGDGSDSLDGGGGRDMILGEDQADTINCGNGDDTAQGGAGSDILSGNADNDGLWGDHNPNAVWTNGSGAADTLYGGDGADSLFGGSGNDVLEGGDGDDVLFGDDYSYDGLDYGDDLLVMSAGRDTLNGNQGSDTVDGSGVTEALNIRLNPYLNGMGVIESATYQYQGSIYYCDNVWGGAFNDTLTGDADANGFVGNGGDDALTGGEGDDTLTGGAGGDTLLGDDGRDLLQGGNSGDSLWGGIGLDTLDGGAGRDTLSGDAGADVFLFNAGYGKDTVTDHNQGTDAAVLDEALWGGGLTAQDVLDTFGSLSANGRKVTLDFGGGDVLVLKGSLFDLGTLADDLSF